MELPRAVDARWRNMESYTVILFCLPLLLHNLLVQIIILITMFKYWCGHLLLKDFHMATNVFCEMFF